jgi:hypothetical protein
MSRLLSTLMCVAVVAAGCGSNPNEPGPFPVTVTLRLGQTVSAGGLGVTFLEVSNDSRCPLDATCISAGDAYLQLAVSAADRSPATLLPLQVNAPDHNTGTVGGYSIAVKSLGPYPSVSRPIDKGTYTVTVEVSR